MLRATLKNILGHKFRLFTTGFAVILGIMFLSAASILADTIGRTFDDLSVSIYAGTDVSVRGVQPFGETGDPSGPRPPVPASLVAQVKAVDGVAAAEGTVFGYAQLVGANGKAVGGNGPPTFGGSWGKVDGLNQYDIVEGRPPGGDDQIVIDRGLAKRGKYALGDHASVLTRAGVRTFTVVGVATFGEHHLDSAAGATFIGFTPSAAQQLIGQPDSFQSVDVVAAPGVSEDVLRDRIAAAVPKSLDVATGKELVKDQQDQFGAIVGGIRMVLSAFAYIALFVGSFIIYNTFQIIVAQRTREMALLRAVGASRRQVLTSVLLEALFVGVVASAAGFVTGIGMAAGIKALMSALHFDLPAEGLIVRPSAAILAVVVGTVVTLFAALFPARKASRVPPIAAMRDVAIEQRDHMRLRTVLGAVIAGLGMLLLFVTLAAGGDGVLPKIGLGAVLTFIGVTTLGPVFAAPVTRILGFPLPRLRGATGNLARENAMRNPKRTARTAAALMIGVALVSAITVMAASVQKSFDKVIGEQFHGDFVVGPGGFGNDIGFSPAAGKALSQKPELGAVMPIRSTPVEATFGHDKPTQTDLFAVDAEASNQITDIHLRSGSLETLKADGIAVYDKWAKKHHVALGDRVGFRFVDTGQKAFTVRAVYGNHDLSGDYFVDLPAFDANVRDQFDQQILIKTADHVSAKAARAAIESVTDSYPNVKVKDRKEFIDSSGKMIQTVVYFVYGMLALAVIIALFGIANTLALSIVERTRELGLLRAVGMTRSQLRSAIRWEAALMSLFGIAGGLGVGTFFGWALMQGFREQGLREFTIPGGQLVAVAVVVLVLSVIAAVIPAWRAGRLDVLEAIGHD